MRQINWEDLPRLAEGKSITEGKKTALTIGVFDGLHRGHLALIAKITEKAPELLPGVVTFRENPKRSPFIREKSPARPVSDTSPRSVVEDIISFEEKTALLDSLGVPLCVIIDFSEHFSKIKGRSFLETLNRYLCPAYIALGANFHCGYRRDTGAGEFKEMAEGLGIRAEIIPPVMEGGLPVSSSRIRRALQAGRIEEAALLLGRPPLN